MWCVCVVCVCSVCVCVWCVSECLDVTKLDFQQFFFVLESQGVDNFGFSLIFQGSGRRADENISFSKVFLGFGAPGNGKCWFFNGFSRFWALKGRKY